MAWPSLQDYQEAIQTPSLAFEDADLRGGAPELNQLGLPKPRSGNFATVYRVSVGGRSWAVRCFTREVTDQRERYAAITLHLRSVRLPYMVGFDYLPRGIRIRGTWFPILKMEWVSGEQLVAFLKNRLGNASALLGLAGRWVAMLTALSKAGIAHGDLQHGNVIVVNGEPRLVDYDGMFVPALAGKQCAEQGHANYQHPQRSLTDFGPRLDNFSGWTIYISLVALAIDPALWNQVKGGDECLLFRRSDFTDPARSQIFTLLASSRNEQLQSLGEFYRELLRLSVNQIPSTDHPRIPIHVAQPAPSGSWVDDFVKPEPTAGTQGKAASASPSGEVDASWVLSFITSPPRDATFVGRVVLVRLTAVLSVLLIIGGIAAAWSSWMPFLGVVFFVLTSAQALAGYVQEPGVVSRQVARKELRRSAKAFREATMQVTVFEQFKRAREVRLERDVQRWTSRAMAASADAQKKVEVIQGRLAKECQPLLKRRNQIDRDEQDALAALGRGLGRQIADLRSQLNQIANDEAQQLAGTLLTRQQEFVRGMLSSAHIAAATIPGLGAGRRGVLNSYGIATALDVDRGRLAGVPGFGPVLSGSLLAWRLAVESRAQKSMPRTLAPFEATAIQSSFEGLRRPLQASLQAAIWQERVEQDAIKGKYSIARQEIEKLEAGPRTAAELATKTIQAELGKAVGLIQNEEKKIQTAANRDLAYHDSEISTARAEMLSLRWKRARTASLANLYNSMRFGHYLGYLAFGKAGGRRADGVAIS